MGRGGRGQNKRRMGKYCGWKYAKRLETCIDIHFEISEVDHYTWIFTSRIFNFALEINFLLNRYLRNTLIK